MCAHSKRLGSLIPTFWSATCSPTTLWRRSVHQVTPQRQVTPQPRPQPQVTPQPPRPPKRRPLASQNARPTQLPCLPKAVMHMRALLTHVHYQTHDRKHTGARSRSLNSCNSLLNYKPQRNKFRMLTKTILFVVLTLHGCMFVVVVCVDINHTL